MHRSKPTTNGASTPMKRSPRPRNGTGAPVRPPGVTPHTSAQGDACPELSADFRTSARITLCPPSHVCFLSLSRTSASVVRVRAAAFGPLRSVDVALINALLSLEETRDPPAACCACVTRRGSRGYFRTVPARVAAGSSTAPATHTGCSRRSDRSLAGALTRGSLSHRGS